MSHVGWLHCSKLFWYEFCYGVFSLTRRYLSFTLISAINFYYVINKLIILVPVLH
jgi:hypothetical protein